MLTPIVNEVITGFVRIQDITLSYTLNERALKTLGMQKVKIFLSAKNLGTFTQWEGLDPELGASYQAGTNPIMTSFTMGVNMSF